MITYTTSKTTGDLEQILKLQQQNLAVNLSPNEIREQGFVTVTHSFDDIRKLHDIEPHIIAKDDDKVIAYLLAMTTGSASDIPVLLPMFEAFNRVMFKGSTVAGYNYIVVGQVCVDKQYRGKGILDNCYLFYNGHFKSKYDFAITEIAVSNQRSVNAHKRIGFEEVYRYRSPDDVEWSIVIWDWKK